MSGFSFLRLLSLILPVIGFTFLPTLAQVDPYPDSTRKYVRQWQDSRYGMFIHWGPVSLKGTEIGWSRGTQVPRAEYDTLYRRFNPTGFNAQEWVTLARNAGMKYMTFTTKHHDGFSMFNTQQSPYNIMNSPFGRDVTLELANECVRQGVRFDTYYSVNDWYHPDWTPYDHGGPGYSLPLGQTPSMARYKDFLKRQLQELIQNYNPGVLWFDGDWFPSWNSTGYPVEVFQYLKNMKPSLVIDNRLQDRSTWQANFPNQAGDYDTPEQVVGAFNDTIPWETCITIAQQWAYSPTNVPKTTQQLVTMFINVMGGDGNLLLNLGPGPDGRMVAGEASRLLELGAWVNPRAAAVYGTRGGPFPPSSWGGATYKDSTLYLHIVNWSGTTQNFPALSANILSARLLVGTGTVQFTQNASGFTVTLPTASRTAYATTIALTLDSAVNPRPPQRYRNVASTCNATQSSTAYSGVPTRACDGNTDGIYNNNSVTHTDSTAGAWWMVNLGANYPISFVNIYNRTDGFMFRLGDYSVILLDQNQNPIWSNRQTTYPNPMTTIDAGGRTARYVRIQLTGTGYLALAEVQVMMDNLTTPILSPNLANKKTGFRKSGILGNRPVFRHEGSGKTFELSGEVVHPKPEKQ